MTYKETLFFVAKCLTINHEEHNKILVENDLKKAKIDWDAVVKVSTSHYVFPALYCNLKRAEFLHYLPEDLVNYMKHITDLNRERNEQIIAQAKEINQLLLDNNITPIFLKGTGNLLEGLYEDIAERMVGDIDFLIDKNQTQKTYRILQERRYYPLSEDFYLENRHLKRLINKNYIAAIEIHKEMTNVTYVNEFNYNTTIGNNQVINELHFLSYKNQLNLSIIAKQINDNGFEHKDISLRNAYDVFLLSKKTSAQNAFDDFIKLKNPLNCFLASCSIVFNHPNSLQYTSSQEVEKYIKFFNKKLENDSFRIKHHKQTEKKLFIKKRLSILKKSFYDKNNRKWLIIRITDWNWLKQKFKLDTKKPKPNS